MTRRHTRRWGLLQIGHAPQPPVAPTITSVSQSAGKAAGGTVITVNGSGYAPGMTSALGTVTYVSGTQCTISTNAHAAGAFGWTVTVNGLSAPQSQSFTYLSAPGTASLTPNNGTQTIATAGVAFTVANLPPLGSNCPFSCTVDGHAVTSLSQSDTSHFTATVPTDTVSGAVNVAVTVDGVTTTTTGAWTYNPPPSEISATNVYTDGGSGTIQGANFVNGCTATTNINGTNYPLTISFVSATTLTFTLANAPLGTYTPSSPGTGWPLTVTNPDGQSATKNVFVVSSVQTPQTTFGANLIAEYLADNATSTGGLLTGLTDSSLHSNDLNEFTAAPSVNASDSDFNGHKSVQFNGTTQWTGRNPFTLNGSGSLYWLVVGKVLASTGADQIFAWYGAADIGFGFQNSTSELGPTKITTFQVVTAPTVLNAGMMAVGGNTTAGALKVSVDGGTIASGGTGVTAATSGKITLGARNDGAGNFSNFKFAYLGVINVEPTANQISNFVAWAESQFNVTNAPQLKSVTNVAANTATVIRVYGANFLPGMTMTVDGGVGALTANSITSTLAEYQFPSTAAGTYGCTLMNTDGRSTTAASSITVTSTAALDPMVIAGSKVVFWGLCGSGGNPQQIIPATPPLAAGGKISGQSDLSLCPNTGSVTQSTGANQPTWDSGNAGILNQPAMIGDGASSFASGGLALTTSNAFYAYMVVKQTSTTGIQTALSLGGPDYSLRYDSGVPKSICQGLTGTPTATWGSAVTGWNIVRARIDAGANPIIGIRVGNGAEVTATSTTATNGLTGAGFNYFERASANFFSGECAALIVLSAAPTAGEDTNIMSYLHNVFGL